eukprot:9778731-Lingulodinium_polyedra.AAC.1
MGEWVQQATDIGHRHDAAIEYAGSKRAHAPRHRMYPCVWHGGRHRCTRFGFCDPVLANLSVRPGCEVQ